MIFTGIILAFTILKKPIKIKKHFNCIFYSEGRKEMFYLTTHSTHFIYGYMASDIW